MMIAVGKQSRENKSDKNRTSTVKGTKRVGGIIIHSQTDK